MTQKMLVQELGVDERSVRFWERRHHTRPMNAPHDIRVEEALLARGVLFTEPTPGVRLAHVVNEDKSKIC